jgi:hypothetical protein
MQDSIHYINLDFFFRQIVNLLSGGQGGISQIPFSAVLLHIVAVLRLPLLVVVALLIASTIYSVRRLESIRHLEHEVLYAGHHDDHVGVGEAVVENTRWRSVVDHINSDNPANWKVAILDADTILDEMVMSMGYHGDSLGERLKSIEASDFTTLDNAWEAHKIRNQIAHQGSDFVLTEREARRVISLYESVFREFKYI